MGNVTVYMEVYLIMEGITLIKEPVFMARALWTTMESHTLDVMLDIFMVM